MYLHRCHSVSGDTEEAEHAIVSAEHEIVKTNFISLLRLQSLFEPVLYVSYHHHHSPQVFSSHFFIVFNRLTVV